MKKILLSLLLFTATPTISMAWENDPYTHLPDDPDLPDQFKIPDGSHFKHIAPARVMYGDNYGQGYRWKHPNPANRRVFSGRYGTWRYSYGPTGRSYSRPYHPDLYDEFHRWRRNARNPRWNPGFRNNGWRPY